MLKDGIHYQDGRLLVHFKRRVTESQARKYIKEIAKEIAGQGLKSLKWNWLSNSLLISVLRGEELVWKNGLSTFTKCEVFVREVELLEDLSLNARNETAGTEPHRAGDIDGMTKYAERLKKAGLSHVMPSPGLVEKTVGRLNDMSLLMSLEIDAKVIIEIKNYFGQFQARVVDFDGDGVDAKPILQVIKGLPLPLLKWGDYKILRSCAPSWKFWK